MTRRAFIILAIAALSTPCPASVRGADLTAMLALACRKTGGRAWRAFRAEAATMLGTQPLPGGVVLLVHRLDTSPQVATLQR